MHSQGLELQTWAPQAPCTPVKELQSGEILGSNFWVTGRKLYFSECISMPEVLVLWISLSPESSESEKQDQSHIQVTTPWGQPWMLVWVLSSSWQFFEHAVTVAAGRVTHWLCLHWFALCFYWTHPWNRFSCCFKLNYFAWVKLTLS